MLRLRWTERLHEPKSVVVRTFAGNHHPRRLKTGAGNIWAEIWIGRAEFFALPIASLLQLLSNHPRFLKAEIAGAARQRQADDDMVKQGNLQNPCRFH
jgi:hypothetical protein